MKRWRVICLMGVIACLVMALSGCQSAEYTPTSKNQTVSSAALGKAGTLRVGVNASSAPLAGQTTSSSRIVGIDVDVASYLADQLGTKVEIIDVGNDPASALEDGSVDMVLGVDASDTDVDYWQSDSYISTGVALFGAQTETSIPTIDSNPKIAAQASSKSSWRVTNLFGDDSLVVQSELKSAFEALAQGSARYVAADAVIGTYVSYSSGFSDKIVALLQDPSGYCAAISDSNTELQGAITTAMNTLINGGMMDVIEKKWLGETVNLDDITVIKAPNAEVQKASANAEGAEGGEGEGESEGGEGEAEPSGEGEESAGATEDAGAGEGDVAEEGY